MASTFPVSCDRLITCCFCHFKYIDGWTKSLEDFLKFTPNVGVSSYFSNGRIANLNLNHSQEACLTKRIKKNRYKSVDMESRYEYLKVVNLGI